MQAELFETAKRGADPLKGVRAQTGWLNQFHMTLRIDHLLITGILALVLYVLVFSFGVEKGKRYASHELEAEKVKHGQIQGGAGKEAVSGVASSATDVRMAPETTPPPAAQASLSPEAAGQTSLSGRYTIQLITFISRNRAQDEVERLKKQGHQAFIIPQGKFFQVCAEAFESLKDARAKLTELQSEGFAPSDAYIRPLTGLIGV